MSTSKYLLTFPDYRFYSLSRSRLAILNVDGTTPDDVPL